MVSIVQAKSLWVAHTEVDISLERTDVMCNRQKETARLPRLIPFT